jgi:hypothetical protein
MDLLVQKYIFTISPNQTRALVVRKDLQFYNGAPVTTTASVVVVRSQGTFVTRQGYFNETWSEEDTFGQYTKFDLSCGLLQAAFLKIRRLPFKS